MQKKLTILWAFAIFVLMFALSPNTASAKCVDGFNTKGKPCGGGDDEGGPQLARVDLELGMVTMGFPVTVQTDSSKKTEFNNTDDLTQVPDITTNFNIDQNTCLVFRGNFSDSDQLFSELKGQLNATITSYDNLFVRVDHKKDTGFFSIQYTDTNLGSMRIQFRNAHVQELPSPGNNSRGWNLSGTVRLWQSTSSSTADANIIECTAPNHSPNNANVILNQ